MPTERFDKLPELKKNRISDAISEAFMHRGTGDIHITQIARSARVSRGSLYAYFLSKEDMLFFSLCQTQRFIWEITRRFFWNTGRLLENAGNQSEISFQHMQDQPACTACFICR